MANRARRFAIGDPGGRRSSEWLVGWKAKTSDVYCATRTLGGNLKASIHESGRCHVRAPGAEYWKSTGPPPKFLEEWTIDPAAPVAHPFGIIIPGSELRAGIWTKHRDRGTVWLPARAGRSVEVAVFLVRTRQDPMPALAAAGWERVLVDERLPDGRRLLAVVGWPPTQIDESMHIERYRAQMAPLLDDAVVPLANPRGVLVATDKKGTPKFVEIAAAPE